MVDGIGNLPDQIDGIDDRNPMKNGPDHGPGMSSYISRPIDRDTLAIMYV